MSRFIAVLFVILATFTLIMPAKTQGQLRVTGISIGSGESPVASGLIGVLELTSESRYLEISVTQPMAWVAYGPRFSGQFNGFASMSAGHLSGAPWVGPYIFASTMIGPIMMSTLQWPFLFGWLPEGREDDSLWGHLGIVSAGVGPLTLSYGLNKYLSEKWNPLPGASLTIPLADGLVMNTGATHNGLAEKWMFFIGTSWRR